ncbi:MAG: hypothetical protein ABI767_10390 [Rhodanobacter sp.]
MGSTFPLEIARETEFVNLDGPLWLQNDYPESVQLRQGVLMPPSAAFRNG